MNRSELIARVVVSGVLLGVALLFLDAVYLPLLLVGPLVTGSVVARMRGDLVWAAGPWVVSGLFHLVYDAVVNAEDMAFHAVVTVVTGLLASAAWAVSRPRGRTA